MDSYFPLTMYAPGLTPQFAVAPEKLSIVLWQLAAEQRFTTSPSPQQLEAAVGRISELVNTVQRETAFGPTPKQFCPSCDYAQMCPVT